MVSGRDLEIFSKACERLYAPGLAPGSFSEHATAFLRELVAADVYCVGDLDQQSGELNVDFSESGEQFGRALEGFGRTMGRYPLFNWDPSVNGGAPFFRRDFYTARQFRDLDIYSESFSLTGWENHAAVHVPTADEHVIFIGLERGKGADYTERDRLILRLGQTQLANARALALAMGTARMPEPPDPAIFAARGFSRREAEVLSWLSEGKTNAEIAVLLQIELPTVKYHLRAIYNKIGSDNRLAATLYALDTARQFPSASGATTRYRVRV